MIVSVTAKRLLFSFILLCPLVNNLNGLMMWKAGLSAVGPLFYSVVALILILILLGQGYSGRDVSKNYLLIATIGAWFAFHLSRYGDPGQIRHYVKFFLPFLLYRFLKLHYADIGIATLKWMEKAMIIWASFALLSALMRAHPSAGEGYYGFIHGNNDYVVMLLAIFPLVPYWSSWLPVAFYVMAVVLTRSKSLVLLAPMLVLLTRSLKVRLLLFGVGAATLALTVAYYVHYFQTHLGGNVALSAVRIIRFMSFGRLKYMDLLLTNLRDKPMIEHLFGSGFQGAEMFLDGKVGVEMDFFDAYNTFGVLGVAFTLFFYYIIPFSSRRIDLRTKLMFAPTLVYSALGGHLFFNPISNLVFAIVVFLLEKQVTGKVGADRASDIAPVTSATRT